VLYVKVKIGFLKRKLKSLENQKKKFLKKNLKKNLSKKAESQI